MNTKTIQERNAQTIQETKEYLAELSAIVGLYDPTAEYIIAVSIFAFLAMCAIVIIAIGEFWGVLLIVLAFIPIGIWLPDSKIFEKSSPTKKDLAERACIIMSACIGRYKNPGQEMYYITYNKFGDNRKLYKEFTSFFPQMDSKKLKRLASVNLGR